MPTKLKSLGYVRYEKVIIIFFTLLVLASVVSFLDPLEKYKNYKDQQVLQKASIVANLIGSYRLTSGKLPWSTSPSKPRPGLAWTSLTSSDLRICGDENCTKPGDLGTTLSLDFFKAPFLIGNTSNLIYLLKGYADQDPTYICFAPQSQEFRTKYQDLYKIDTKLKSIPTVSRQNLCNDNVNWLGDNICYICIVQ